jgi:triosephosphate isomerase
MDKERKLLIAGNWKMNKTVASRRSNNILLVD